MAQCFAPKTIHDWYRELIAEKYDSTGENQKRRGRKPVSADLQELVLRLAEQNPHWGYKRIRDYVEYLGYEVSFMTVKRILNKHGIYPSDHDRSNSNWDLFFNTHQDVITACDFATYELVTPYGLQREHILFFENIATREVWLGGIAHDPDGGWMAQIARNQTDMWNGKLKGYAYLIHDRDPLFLGKFTDIMLETGRWGDLIADNDSKGCGAVMRTAPVGLFFEPELAYHMGCDVSAITHGHQTGITAGGAMPMLVSFLRRGKRIDDAVDETIDFLKSARAKRSDGDRDAAETVAALKHAKYATSANELGQGLVAEEVLAIGVHCALKHSDDFRSGVLEAVNIDGDSDSTGAITGNLLGAVKGVAGIPEEWVTNLRERRIVETVAWDLLAEIETDEDDYVFESWWNKYPGY